LRNPEAIAGWWRIAGRARVRRLAPDKSPEAQLRHPERGGEDFNEHFESIDVSCSGGGAGAV